MGQVSVTHDEWALLKEAWTASSATKHEYGCIEDMELPYSKSEIYKFVEGLQKKGVIRVPLERETVDDRTETRFQFERNYRCSFEKFAALFLVGGNVKVDVKPNVEKKGGKPMMSETHTLSLYDTARKALKEAKIKTDTVMTKDTVCKLLLKQKGTDEALYQLGVALKEEMSAKENKKKEAEKERKDAAAKKVAAKKAATKDKEAAAKKAAKDKATAAKDEPTSTEEPGTGEDAVPGDEM